MKKSVEGNECHCRFFLEYFAGGNSHLSSSPVFQKPQCCNNCSQKYCQQTPLAMGGDPLPPSGSTSSGGSWGSGTENRCRHCNNNHSRCREKTPGNDACDTSNDGDGDPDDGPSPGKHRAPSRKKGAVSWKGRPGLFERETPARRRSWWWIRTCC